MPNSMTESWGTGRRGFVVYGLGTLVLVGAATVMTGGARDLMIGMFAAWVLQLLAFQPLARALSERRDATRAWLGGLGIRGAGLVATGGLALSGVVGSDLPVAYGTTMMVLLMVEAGWLFRRLPRPRGVVDGGFGTDNGIERTTTG
jgi:hypothetical protein